MKKFLLILIIVLGIGFLIFSYGGKIFKGNDLKKYTDDDRIISKNVEYSIDESDFLNILIDLELSSEITEEENISITIDLYDTENVLLESYTANSKYYNLNNNKEIHMAFSDTLGTNFENLASIETEVSIIDKLQAPSYEYMYVIEEDPKVMFLNSLYRISLDLDDFFKNNSGLAKLEYSDESIIIKRISYLIQANYIGVSSTEDLSFKNEAELEKVTVYQIGNLTKNEKEQ